MCMAYITIPYTQSIYSDDHNIVINAVLFLAFLVLCVVCFVLFFCLRPVFNGVCVAHLFSFLCCAFFLCLSSSCVLCAHCCTCMCIWILHSRFSPSVFSYVYWCHEYKFNHLLNGTARSCSNHHQVRSKPYDISMWEQNKEVVY